MRSYLLILLILSLSSSTSLDVTGSLDSSGSSHMLMKYDLPNFEGKEIYLNLSGDLDIIARDKSGLTLETAVKKEGNHTIVSVIVPFDYVEFESTSNSFTQKNQSLWSFALTIGSSEKIDDFSASLKFPAGTTIKSTNGGVSGGNSLLLSWSGKNIDNSHMINLRAGYEITPQENEFMVPGLILFVIILLSLFYATTRKKLPNQIALKLEQSNLEKNSIFQTLDEIDKDLLREISKQKGRTTQAHLYLNTHIPKATLSRRLASLTNRGIIQKSQKGNKNLITLTKIMERS